MKRVLVVRQDNNGDVLLTGPAVRAVAGVARVSMLCGPNGAAAAALLPGVDETIVAHAAWIDAHPQPVSESIACELVARLRAGAFDEAIVMTSFHQSPLPMALLLRMAGVARIGAISVDYPGSLLDVRHHVRDDVHEVERNVSLVAAMGYSVPPSDDARLRVRSIERPPGERLAPGYVVVHPGCSVPARTWSERGFAEATAALRARGYRVVLTGSASERAAAHRIAASTGVEDRTGATNFAQFAGMLADAAVVVSGNTAAAHVAAAVGTPVVSIFPPTVPAIRFAPWKVAHVLLGDQSAPCAGCRARECPVAGQPCLANVTARVVVDAVESLASGRATVVAS